MSFSTKFTARIHADQIVSQIKMQQSLGNMQKMGCFVSRDLLNIKDLQKRVMGRSNASYTICRTIPQDVVVSSRQTHPARLKCNAGGGAEWGEFWGVSKRRAVK